MHIKQSYPRIHLESIYFRICFKWMHFRTCKKRKQKYKWTVQIEVIKKICYVIARRISLQHIIYTFRIEYFQLNFFFSKILEIIHLWKKYWIFRVDYKFGKSIAAIYYHSNNWKEFQLIIIAWLKIFFFFKSDTFSVNIHFKKYLHISL